MKMHHLDKEKVEAVMLKVKQVVESGQYPADIIEEIFQLSEVDGEKFLECKAHPIQKEKVNFEIDPEKGVRFFDPFNCFFYFILISSIANSRAKDFVKASSPALLDE